MKELERKWLNYNILLATATSNALEISINVQEKRAESKPQSFILFSSLEFAMYFSETLLIISSMNFNNSINTCAYNLWLNKKQMNLKRKFQICKLLFKQIAYISSIRNQKEIFIICLKLQYTLNVCLNELQHRNEMSRNNLQ